MELQQRLLELTKLIAHNEWEAALAKADAILAAAPNTSKALEARAAALDSLGRNDEGIDAYGEVIRLLAERLSRGYSVEEPLSEALFRRGSVFARSARLEEAFADLQEATELVKALHYWPNRYLERARKGEDWTLARKDPRFRKASPARPPTRKAGWLVNMQWVSGSSGTDLYHVVGQIDELLAVVQSYADRPRPELTLTAIPVTSGNAKSPIDLRPFVEFEWNTAWYRLSDETKREELIAAANDPAAGDGLLAGLRMRVDEAGIRAALVPPRGATVKRGEALAISAASSEGLKVPLPFHEPARHGTHEISTGHFVELDEFISRWPFG